MTTRGDLLRGDRHLRSLTSSRGGEDRQDLPRNDRVEEGRRIRPWVEEELSDPGRAGTLAAISEPESGAAAVVSAVDIGTAWAICADLFREAIPRPVQGDVQRLHQELLFCLLGGFGVSYELALSASACVSRIDPFAVGWTGLELEGRLVSELGQPQFEPRRVDGRLRRYRFPVRKAELIVRARQWLMSQGNLMGTLVSLVSERERRRLVCECPGVGPKTASWLLRNLGLATDLAILDVHVIRALKATGRINEARLPQDYESIELVFLDWCRELEAPAAAFDLFLWEWQRGSLTMAE